jgi:hypothetical protein
LIAVTVRMKIKGTDPRPGLEAPKIEKICKGQIGLEVSVASQLTLRITMKRK